MESSLSDLFLLASAVAGRRAAVHAASEADHATYAYSDGQTIILPSGVAILDDVWMHVVSQALLINAGSLEPALLRRLLARPVAARCYAHFEVMRAARLMNDRLPRQYTQRLLSMSGHVMSPDATTSVNLALSEQASRVLVEGIPEFVGTVRPLAVLRSGFQQGGLAGLTAIKLAPEIQPTSAVREVGEDEPTEDNKALRLLSNPFSNRENPISNLLNQILGLGVSRSHRQGVPDAGGGAEMPIGRVERVWKRGVNVIRGWMPPDAKEPNPSTESSTEFYPEWDRFTQRYRQSWVCVDEVDPWHPDGTRATSLVLKAPSKRLRNELSRLSLDFEMHRRQPDGPEFDVSALIDHAVRRSAGDPADAPRLYRASMRTKRDLGVVVVMDASGSTEECNEHGRSAFEHHAAVAYRIAQALDALGDRVALYGFQSWGRHRVHMVRLKGHEERWTARVAERLNQLEAVGFTRTGAAVRHANRLLHSQIRLPHRLLVLITDGLSYDSDYEGIYAEDDTRKALVEARAAGTACVCVCMGGSIEASQLERVFGASQLLVVDDSAQVDTRIRNVCSRALASVSRRSVAARPISTEPISA